ncbi:MAG: zinc-ribbon domain-containing protein [Leptolyngbyaceae cyanobacterium MO_188.B28]|nr:zinc-ribbon domain-containing protein [Leptolyngbyaceae cyanobacterium MO_188.B28]
MKCPKCQTENQADSKFCVSCGAALNVAPPPPPPDEGIRGRPPSAGKKYAHGKDPTLALILSLILPGLAIGQFYNGDVMKGIVMLVGALILSFTILGSAAIWIWSVIDAYQVAKGNQSLWN